MGVHRSTYYRWKGQVERRGWRCSGRGSAGGRRCPTSSRCWSSSGSSRLRSGTRAGAEADRVAAGAAGMGRADRVAQRGLQDAGPARARTRAPSAWRWSPATGRRLSRHASPAPEPHIDTAAGRVGRHRLFLRRPAARRQGPGLADHRDRHLQQLRLGRSGRLPTGRADRRADLGARPPRRRRAPAARAGGSSACSPTTATSSAARLRRAAARRRRAQPDPLRTPADQRPRRTPTPHDPRGVLATRVRALPPSPLHRPQDATSRTTSTTTTTTANTTDEPRPGDAPPTSSTVPARWSRDEPHLSAQLGVCSD